MKRKPNWLLRGLMGVSLGIHLVIFMHISGFYSSNAPTYIELTFQDVSKRPTRSIPKHRHRSKPPAQLQDLKRLKVTQRLISQFRPTKVESVEKDLPEGLVEGISMPDISEIPGMDIYDWTPVGLGVASDDYATSNNYLEMVRLKIERHKKYPDTARIRQIEGCVTIRFVITSKGDVKAADIVKTSRHKVLDTAALRAVKDAAPFPKPPRRLFKGEIPLELTIVFELT